MGMWIGWTLWASLAGAQESVCHLIPAYSFEASGVSSTLHAPHVRVGELESVADAMGVRNVPVVLDIGEVRNAWSGWTQVRAGIAPGLGDPGVRTLGLSLSFLADAREIHGPWAERFILAHELGHHVEAHRWSAKEHEVQADAWATRTLIAMGASRAEVQAGIRFLAAETSWHEHSSTHPTPLDRVSRVDEVFLEATASVPASAELACPRGRCVWEVEAACTLQVGPHRLSRGQRLRVGGRTVQIEVVPRASTISPAVSQVEIELDGSCASAGTGQPLLRAVERQGAVAEIWWGTTARRDVVLNR